jgi:hypothetical protein
MGFGYWVSNTNGCDFEGFEEALLFDPQKVSYLIEGRFSRGHVCEDRLGGSLSVLEWEICWEFPRSLFIVLGKLQHNIHAGGTV